MSHRFDLRVYYEDTDMGGIVYYANYLKFIERARTEYIRALGVDQTRLQAELGLVFVVRRVEADYLVPARFDDELSVVSELCGLGGARVTLRQSVERGHQTLFAADVTLAMLSAGGAPARIPAEIRQCLRPHLLK